MPGVFGLPLAQALQPHRPAVGPALRAFRSPGPSLSARRCGVESHRALRGQKGSTRVRAAAVAEDVPATKEVQATANAPAAAEAAALPVTRDSRQPPAKYAIIAFSGRQYFVEEGRYYTCNRIAAEPGSTIQFGQVLFVKSNGGRAIGQPYVENAVVEAEVLEDVKGPKLTIFKMRRKKHYRRKTGHRQPLTKFLVTKIEV